MLTYAFATSTCGQHFKVIYNTDKDELFKKVKHCLPVRTRFEEYLQQALTSPEQLIRLTDLDAYEDEYLEILLGESKAIKKYIRLKNQ
ncbi:hypothetical protein Q0590_36350 [Rhodocytophaga aerolata]|uniref:Uncharacterized protein n=1 Tax=Rhodocytophaga aerolata TaxID=455078 RepID=A0ABT8RI78_9BACT|nr:hypothetical protein [Rhodocytophaga aerolata]MDO1451803.1 hypothetical protein [Rhodocytophaga aerolata]